MTENTWLKDNNDNKCSVEYFGSREEAQRALDSLENCKECVNCSRCSGCSRCSRCSRCLDCSGCSDCSDCSGCSRCSDCSHVAWLYSRENIVAVESEAGAQVGPPPVPVIE